MTDELQTVEAEGAKVLDGAESAVASLLAQLRLPADTNTAATVYDWLDQHGVLDDIDEAAKKIAADTEAKATADAAEKAVPLDGATEVPAAAVPAAAVPAAVGEGSSLASGAAPPIAAPVEATHMDPTPESLAAAAEPANGGTTVVPENVSGTVPAEATPVVTREETKSAIVGAMRTVIDLLERL